MNNTRIANNSNLPNIIAPLSTHFEKSDKLEKLPFGPIISPKPGPTLDIEVAAADIDVTKFKPSSDSRAVTRKKMSMYRNIKEIIESINFSSTLLFSYLILNIPLVYIIFFNYNIINMNSNSPRKFWSNSCLIIHIQNFFLKFY